jgi:FkbM family methyltransferase
MLPSYFTEGRAILEKISRDAAQTACLAGRTICRVLGKYIVYVDSEDVGIAPHLCLDGFWESWITIALTRELKPGLCCLDVGANHGYYTLIMGDAVGPSGRVLSVEPNPATAELLALTLEVNGLSGHCSVAQLALAEKDAPRVGFIVPKNRGLMARLGESAGVDETFVDVEMTTVDHLTSSWPRVDLVKVDAEGAEDRIWEGMSRTITHNPSILILLEFTPSRYRDSKRFLDSICGSGFMLRYITDSGGVYPIARQELLSTPKPEHSWMLHLRRRV